MIFTSTGQNTRRGGVDLIISLTADQAAAIGTDSDLAEAVDTVLVGLAALRMNRDPDVSATGGPPSLKDQPVSAGLAWDEWLLSDAAALLAKLAGVRDAATRLHTAHGGTYGQLANALGIVRATAQSRRDGLAAAQPDPAELWATGGHAPVNHPGVPVPAALRSWSVPWPGYLPVDITPPELRSAERAAAEHWVRDATTDPAGLPDRPERQARAIVSWETDDRGRPLNPAGRTGRTGRNLGAWGENAAADPIVTTGDGTARQVLLIRRGDCGQWAIPGGHVDQGETVTAALARELHEETGVDVSGLPPRIIARTVVDDPRATDHAWIATVAAAYHLPAPVTPCAGDDAADARWWPAADADTLTAALTSAGEQLYPAHRGLLTTALAR